MQISAAGAEFPTLSEPVYKEEWVKIALHVKSHTIVHVTTLMCLRLNYISQYVQYCDLAMRWNGHHCILSSVQTLGHTKLFVALMSSD